MIDSPSIAGSSFTDQVLSVKVDEVAQRIASQGQRAAIQASTVEIVALALMVAQLTAIADRTYELFVTADELEATRNADARHHLRSEVKNQIATVGGLLEALGYGRDTTSTTKETTNG